MSDKINPSHYKLPNGIEANDVTMFFGFNEGNVLKYVWRAGKKDGEYRLTDLRKAKWYLDQLIEKEELNELSSEAAVPECNSADRHTFVSDYYVAEDLRAWRDAT